jgi:hypothetical protein
VPPTEGALAAAAASAAAAAAGPLVPPVSHAKTHPNAVASASSECMPSACMSPLKKPTAYALRLGENGAMPGGFGPRAPSNRKERPPLATLPRAA